MNQKQFTAEVLSAEKSLYHIALSILGNNEDCADAMQSAILRAFEKLHTLRKEAYFKTWLTRILINECYDIIRSKKGQISYEAYFETHIMAEEQQTDSEVFDTVMRLEPNYRIPFVMHYVEGFTVREVGRMLGISESAVKMRLHRSRKLLKAKLTGACENEKE